ncbi:hypothetical protein [Streptomyces sp. CoH17]|nr:hypothetical protein [Streptomyces sp. CoH17]
MRRLIHSILDMKGGQLRDDATLLMFEWRPPPRGGRSLPRPQSG